ncbi:hypothetical protein ACMA5I_03575 [Paracoccaceae bacterium GXU_MW_L88]
MAEKDVADAALANEQYYDLFVSKITAQVNERSDERAEKRIGRLIQTAAVVIPVVLLISGTIATLYIKSSITSAAEEAVSERIDRQYLAAEYSADFAAASVFATLMERDDGFTDTQIKEAMIVWENLSETIKTSLNDNDIPQQEKVRWKERMDDLLMFADKLIRNFAMVDRDVEIISILENVKEFNGEDLDFLSEDTHRVLSQSFGNILIGSNYLPIEWINKEHLSAVYEMHLESIKVIEYRYPEIGLLYTMLRSHMAGESSERMTLYVNQLENLKPVDSLNFTVILRNIVEQSIAAPPNQPSGRTKMQRSAAKVVAEFLEANRGKSDVLEKVAREIEGFDSGQNVVGENRPTYVDKENSN